MADYTLYVKTKGNPKTEEESQSILPCPFCGGVATLCDSVRLSGSPQVFVICTECHTRGRESPITTEKKLLRKVAIDLWNERWQYMSVRSQWFHFLTIGIKCVACCHMQDKETPYCPECGAKMDSEYKESEGKT